MPIDWQVVAPADDAAQPVNVDVLVEVATLIAHRARTAAREANRRGDFGGAVKILNAAAVELRALAPGDPKIGRLADELQAETAVFVEPMSAMDHKSRHFAEHLVAHSRMTDGKARRSTR